MSRAAKLRALAACPAATPAEAATALRLAARLERPARLYGRLSTPVRLGSLVDRRA